jgi:hypothetical protein
VTARAARRAWNERPVRVWLILLLLVAAATGYFVVERVSRAMRERDLVFNGEPVKATLTSIESSTVQGRMFSRMDGPPVTLSYTLKDGRKVANLEGRLTPGIEGSVAIGGTIDIRVDPTDPRRWTDRVQPRPWTAELTVVYGLVPLLALLLGLVLITRARVLSVWKHGAETPATVIDAKQSSIAPLSRIVRFVLADGSGDKRVYSVLCPSDAVPPPGDPIELIAPTGKPSRAIVASLYA